MGLSVWRETSKKLTVCREKGKNYFVQITVLFVAFPKLWAQFLKSRLTLI